MERRVKASSESTAFLIMLAIGLVLLNVLSVFIYTRWDLTERQLHTLSSGTKRILGQLEDEVTVRGYFSENLPPPFDGHERAVRDLLDEYAAYSNGKLRVEIIHPGDNEDHEKRAREDGVVKASHTSLEQDQAHEVLGYRGVSFHYRGETKAIPVLSPRADISGLEYDFTTKIRELVTTERRTLGFVTGHGEPTINQPPPQKNPNQPPPDPGISWLHQRIENYNLREVSLGRTKLDPAEFHGIAVVGPTKAFSEADLYALDQYFMRGGTLAFFVNGVQVQDDPRMGVSATTNETGVNELLLSYGVQINHDVVLDTQAEEHMVIRFEGGRPMISKAVYPGWPRFSATELADDHALLFRLPGLTLLWPSTVRVTRAAAEDEDIRARVLVRTTDQAWSVRDNFSLDTDQSEEDWAEQREGTKVKGRFPIAVELSGNFDSHFSDGRPSGVEAGEGEDEPEHLGASSKRGRLLVVGDADFMLFRYLASRGRPRHARSNLTFVENAIDWLAEDEDLIEIRAKSLEDPALPDLEDSHRNWVKWGNVLAWPLLFGAFGVARWRIRKRRRKELEKSWGKGGDKK